MSDVLTLDFPYNWNPRHYQQNVWDYMYQGIERGRALGFPASEIGPRAICVWHRRAGKDLTALHILATAMQKRPGLYMHVLPTQVQARRIAWHGKDRSGKPMLAGFPPKLFTRSPREDSMTLWMRCGQAELDIQEGRRHPSEEAESVFREIGSDDVDSMRGQNPVGVVFSEYAWQDPTAWDVVRPIIAENGGWAMFISTPYGMNHFHTLYEQNKDDPHWFTEILSADSTYMDQARTQRVLPDVVLEAEKKTMSRELFEQEYYCSFVGGMVGAYYAQALADLLAEDRIKPLGRNSGQGVWTWWDIGYHDATAIWFVQSTPQETTVIDYMEGTQQSLEQWAKRLHEKPYNYAGHVFPWDIGKHDPMTGRTSLQFIQRLLHEPILIAPKSHPPDRIEAVRMTLSRCWFDSVKCARGLTALRQYRAEKNEKSGLLMPVHDWTSHAADAFGHGCQMLEQQRHMGGFRGPILMKPEIDVYA